MDKITKLLKDTISAQDNTHYQDILVELRNTQEKLKEVEKENNRLEARIDSFCARYGYDVEELN